MSDLRVMYITNPRDLQINLNEVKRYLKVKEFDATMQKFLEESLSCVYATAEPKAVYSRVKIKVSKDTVDFGFMKVKSQNLATHLSGCSEAFVVATTLGVAIDRLIERYVRILQTKAMMCGAISSALIESFCDNINKFLIYEKEAVSRFSPGYGDFSLEHQKEILDFLDANKRLGISLTESMMMVPEKSVTAIIGLKRW